jgi:hypothetical protein
VFSVVVRVERSRGTETNVYYTERTVGRTISTRSDGPSSTFNSEYGQLREFTRLWRCGVPDSRPRIGLVDWSVRCCGGESGGLLSICAVRAAMV